jgi:hypothetical protein
MRRVKAAELEDRRLAAEGSVPDAVGLFVVDAAVARLSAAVAWLCDSAGAQSASCPAKGVVDAEGADGRVLEDADVSRKAEVKGGGWGGRRFRGLFGALIRSLLRILSW